MTHYFHLAVVEFLKELLSKCLIPWVKLKNFQKKQKYIVDMNIHSKIQIFALNKMLIILNLKKNKEYKKKTREWTTNNTNYLK